MSLQTPYCLVGLGRTNNYVEEMFAGVSRRQVREKLQLSLPRITHSHYIIQDQNYLFYEGVIPNSQLIFIPYQPENVHDSST